MFDIKAIRDNPAAFDEGLKRRGLAPLSADILALDEKRRLHVTKLQEAQARRNAASKEVGKAKAQKAEATAVALMAEVASLKDFLTEGEAEERRLTEAMEKALAVIPNIPRDDVPLGSDETGNREMRRWGEALIARPLDADQHQAAGPNIAEGAATFAPKQHFELGEALGMMDFETAAKVSGARFVFLKGQLARLERALTQFMLDTHTADAGGGVGGYTEVNPPLLVRDAAAYGTANLPKFAEDLFQTSRGRSVGDVFDKLFSNFVVEGLTEVRARELFADLMAGDGSRGGTDEENRWIDYAWRNAKNHWHALLGIQHRLWLIPTAEVSLTNLVREQILDEDALPLRFTAGTPCFRSEAGSAGRDVRGMIRQHQFTKVELVSITTPEASLAEHERMTRCAETILEKLGLPYRTMLLCTGDMGFASQKTYDIEVWLPGQNAYREISSCSVCGDFQARRMSARYRRKGDGPAAGGQPKGSRDVQFVHTLNGSGLAVGRTLIAVLENYQQADGSIVIPEVLRPYMGGKDHIVKA